MYFLNGLNALIIVAVQATLSIVQNTAFMNNKKADK